MLASSLASEKARLIGVDKYSPRTFKARNYAPGKPVIPRAPQAPEVSGPPATHAPPRVDTGQVQGSGLEVDARAAKVSVTNQAMDAALGQAADDALVAAGNKLLSDPALSPTDKNATLGAIANARRIGQRDSSPLAPVGAPAPTPGDGAPPKAPPAGETVTPPPLTVAGALMDTAPTISLGTKRRK